MARPDFLVVGAPKCGTTAFHAFLNAHPDIFMPEFKELHFFGSDLSGLASNITLQQHAALFDDARSDQCVGESCIWALYSKTAAQEIRRSLPGAKIVIMLRDPVHMVHALHNEYLWGGYEDVIDFARALELEAERKEGRQLPRSGEPTQILFYREVARFSEQVKRYYAVFGRKRVHVVLLEDMRRDLPGVYGELLEFLEVDPTFRPKFQIVNPRKNVWSYRLHWFLNDRDHFYRRLARGLVPVRPLRSAIARSLTFVNGLHPPRRGLDPALSRRLRKELAPEVEQLSTVLCRDLRRWLPEPARGS